MYDLLVVGGGLTAATLVALLRDRLKICVIDCRKHLGGNCFDYADSGTLIQKYGPHIFHSDDPVAVGFLSRFTEWTPYNHTVLAEIEDGGKTHHVPFPYSDQTVQSLGRELSEDEVIDKFFRGYSEKTWGMQWEGLPESVRRRVPRQKAAVPRYYREQFVALPRAGYTPMLLRMFEGAEVILAAPPKEWTRIQAKTVVFTGRPDLIPLPGEDASIAEASGLELDYRSLDIQLTAQSWELPAACWHACTLERPWTRKTSYKQMTGGASMLVSTETPRAAHRDELNPYYPISLPVQRQRFNALASEVRRHYPHLHLAGRLGSYRYLDMHHAVRASMTLAERLWKK